MEDEIRVPRAIVNALKILLLEKGTKATTAEIALGNQLRKLLEKTPEKDATENFALEKFLIQLRGYLPKFADVDILDTVNALISSSTIQIFEKEFLENLGDVLEENVPEMGNTLLVCSDCRNKFSALDRDSTEQLIFRCPACGSIKLKIWEDLEKE